jgi:hypothetical protein
MASSANASFICQDAAHPPQKYATVAYTNECAKKRIACTVLTKTKSRDRNLLGILYEEESCRNLSLQG